MDSVALHAGTVLTGTGEVLHDATVGIESGRIRDVTEETSAENYDRTVDCTGSVLMPGLVDAHVHLVDDALGRHAG